MKYGNTRYNILYWRIFALLITWVGGPVLAGLDIPPSHTSDNYSGFSSNPEQTRTSEESDTETSFKNELEKVLGPKAEKFQQKMTGILVDDSLDLNGQLSALTSFLDEEIVGSSLSATEQVDLFRTLADRLPASKLNEPLRAILRAKEVDMGTLFENHLATGMSSAVAAEKANRTELSRRLQTDYGIAPADAKQIAGIMQASGNTKNKEMLAASYSPEALKALLKKMETPLQEEKRNGQGARNIADALREAAKIPPPLLPLVANPGNFIAEPRTGHFLISPDTLGRADTAEVARTILREGGKISVAGTHSETYDKFLSQLPAEDQQRIQMVKTPGRTDIWITDFRGLPVQETASGKLNLIDTKYYHPTGYNDSLPSKESSLSGIPLRPFDQYLEGGNILSLQGKKGTPVVAVSERFLSHNSRILGIPPEQARTQLQAQFADGAKLVMPYGMEDGTGHLDMVTKPASNGKVYVADFSPFLPRMLSGFEEAAQDQSRMEENYRLLDQDVELIKVPQIPRYNRLSYSKLNNISFTGKDGQAVYIVPNYPDHPLNAEVNASMQQIFSQNEGPGTRYHLIDTNLNEKDGVFHCVFPQVCYPFPGTQ